MAARLGDANENGGEPTVSNKRRTTKYFVAPTTPHHGFTFKAFTQESLTNIQRRKNSKSNKKNSSAYLDPNKVKLDPDPYLASGQQLPPAFIRQLPPELVGKPIEDIDPYYWDQETFVIISRGKELTRFSASKALYLLGPFHPIRRVVLYILVSPIFNLLVILTILTNCILMTVQASEAVEKTEIIFTIVYTTEMGLKVLARGFILDEFSYLRDPWNWLDFTVILMAYLTIVVQDLGNLSVMRTFRVLRALKTVAIIPGMKTIVGAVIDSVKNLKDVVVLTLFSLSVFSLLGLQIYMGQLTQKCILNGPSNMSDVEWHSWCSNSSHWVPEPDDEIFGAYRLCGNATGAQSCPEKHTCLQGFGPNPDYGFTNFDTFGWALICSFRLMTQDFWEGLYMQVLKTAGSWHVIFFIVSIFLGSIYLMNLILAIVAMSYNELQRRAEEEEEAAAEDEANFLNQCKLMEELAASSEQRSVTSTLYGAQYSPSYRPSVEIGILGQSMLANLCQNGLLGEQVRDKLEQQIGLPVSTDTQQKQQQQCRSHSFSVIRNYEQGRGNQPEHHHHHHHHHHSQRSNHRCLYKDCLSSKRASYSACRNCPLPGAASMTELRRKSSVRIGSQINPRKRSQQCQCRTPPLSPKDFDGDPSGSRSPTRFASDGAVLKASRGSGARSSTTSDRDLVALRQRAALIRIVSDDYSVTTHSVSQPAQPSFLGNRVRTLTTPDCSNVLTKQGDPYPADNSSSYQLTQVTNNQVVPHNKLSAIPSKSAHELNELGRHNKDFCLRPVVHNLPRRQSELKNLSVDSASVHLNSQQSSTSGCKRNSTLTLQDQGSSSQHQAPILIRHQSEAAICTQPTSINSFFPKLPNQQKQTVATPQDNTLSSPQAISLLSPINKSQRSLIPSPSQRQLNVEQTSKQMHHLSVENFQQFGGNSSSTTTGQLLTTPSQTLQYFDPEITHCTGQDRRRSRLDSRGHINPHTMLRSSMNRQARNSMFLMEGGAPSSAKSRRLSQDFVRRTSDWSRLSMSGNVDLRRLLRLWAHTNPYQGNRPSLGSISNASQSVYQQSIKNSSAQSMNSNGQPVVVDTGRNRSNNPGFSSNNNSRINSPRPSSVGSTRQAYELISVFSRNHDLYTSDGASGYAMPLDDSMIDRMSVTLRDKCLAYCLSCLDVLCIWECCGAWLKIQQLIALIVFDPFTELFIIFCILINTLFMALDSDDADAQMKSIFERGNYFFTATFAVEASMKIMALSPKFYFREGWNVFDSIIVGLSLLELGLEGVYGLSVLRSFRLLRVFKLAKSWPTLNLLISIMGKAVGDVGNLTFVLAIIVFIFAVVGMQLFGTKYVAHNFPSGELPRWNFTDFMHSFMIVFRILCAEWIEPMWDCLLVGGWPCIPFFLIAVTVGNLVVLNLFLALLLASFGASNLSSPQADNVDTKKLQEAIARFSRFGKWIKRNVSRFLRWLTACLYLRRDSKGLNSASPKGHGKAYKERRSHIAAMSKLERLKNIEERTKELKSRIRSWPESHHHQHLKQLAQLQLQETANRPQVSCNFNYQRKLYTHDECSEPTAANKQPVPHIPIIVNEAIECLEMDVAPMSTESSDNSLSRHSFVSQQQVDQNFSTGSQPLTSESNSSDRINRSDLGQLAYQTVFKQNSIRYPANYSINMQPIREDSRDTDSSSSALDISNKCSHRTVSPTQEPTSSSTSTSQSNKCTQLDSNEHEKDDEVDALYEPLIQTKPSTQKIEFEGSMESDQQVASSNHSSHKSSEQNLAAEPAAAKSGLYLKAPKHQDMEEDDERALQDIDAYLEKCICIGILCLKWFLFRQYVRKIVEHRYFDQCILVLIVISSGTLALEDKHLNERPNLKRTLDVLDTIFTIIFSLEMIFKWVAFGIKRYFGNIWSWLDFFIVLVSFINLMASIFGSGKIQALKTMRTLRAMRGLRPLRALQRFQGMRVVVNALIQAIPSIFNVLLVCLIFWLIFSIMGVQMFGGKFWRCINPETRKIVTFEEAANRYECIERNLTWVNPQINFDNVLNAYLALFQVATFKGWIDIMNSASDSRTRDEQPIREANIYMYFYFVFFVIFGSFFTLNLFIGVIIDNFNEQKKKTGGSLEIFMTDDQKKYYHAMKKMRSKRPIKAMTRPKLKFQAYMFDITTSKEFDMIIMIIIGLNMFVMALEHFGQSQEFSTILENLNLIFIAIFTLECLSKIFAMRHFYFREPWNIFDFIVVDLSILGVVMKEYVAKYFVSPTLLRVVRVVKVGRVLRLVKGAKGIRTLLFALAMSLPALFNICLLLFLVMFIYAIFGMSFFMNVRPRAGIDETFNFETFSSSIIVLFQMSTSAGWDLVLDPLMDEENDCQKPEPALGIEGTCGNKTIAIIYLISYVIVTFLIIINMYIAVILENYSQATEDVQEGLTDDDYEMYYEIWQKFDPNGTQYLPYSKLSDFVDALEDPLRIPKPNDLALVVMDINIYQGDQCYCVDILDALTKYFFTRKGLVIQVNEHLQKVQSTLHETPFERITTTFLIKRENYCAKIIQNCWRKWKQQTDTNLKLKSATIQEHNCSDNIKTLDQKSHKTANK